MRSHFTWPNNIQCHLVCALCLHIVCVLTQTCFDIVLESDIICHDDVVQVVMFASKYAKSFNDVGPILSSLFTL